MRNVRRLVRWAGVMLLLCGRVAWAHSEEALGHHWADHAYLNEMRFQVAPMMVIALAAWLVSWLVKVHKVRRVR